MLVELSIQNLALIENLRLSFHQGFTSLTGETGAGKSILLDALGLTLGERADTGLVRYDKTRADITAMFDLSQLPNVQQWLVENELESDEAQCLLRRTVNAKGGSKAYINGIAVPAAQLKTLGNLLIDIHGQHEHQSLLSNQKQLELLDAFAAHNSLVTDTKNKFQAWQKLQKQLNQLKSEQAERQGRLELLIFQHKEFSQLNPQEGEFEELSEKQQTLSHASEIQQACAKAYQCLEDESGVTDVLQTAIHSLEQVSSVMPKIEPIIQQLNSALIDIQESASEIQNQVNHIELDPQELDVTEYRLSELYSTAKKYQLEPENLVEKYAFIQEELAQLQNPETSVEGLESEISAAKEAFKQSAQNLTDSRLTAAKKLSHSITDGMHQLGMPNGEFFIEHSTAKNASNSGLDKIEFLVSANKGLPLQPLAKVASGGELSRISLAIQVATAEVAQLPTLIFDEVDVGIGGAVAEMVGKKLQALGQFKQILSITHLAQVASHGHQHLKIEKYTKSDLTFTQVSLLEKEQKVEEIARMLGGVKMTQSTLQHAQEMLLQAHSH